MTSTTFCCSCPEPLVADTAEFLSWGGYVAVELNRRRRTLGRAATGAPYNPAKKASACFLGDEAMITPPNLLRTAALALAFGAGIAAAQAQGYPPPGAPPPGAPPAPPPGATPGGPPPVPVAPVPQAVPVAPPGYWVWEPAHWRWDGFRYVWVNGRYVHPHGHHARWVEGRWVLRHGAWVWVDAHWG